MKPIKIENFRSNSRMHNILSVNHSIDIESQNKKIDGKFIKGPIPLSWIKTAAKLPGKALEISMVLWFLKSVNKRNTVRLSGKMIKEFGVSRPTYYRGLKALEDAGLVSIKRRVGRSPVVKIIF
jgi:DNA-binding transcriptional ArsR family regulator